VLISLGGLMNKPTKDEILQALDDLDEGKPISADMRVAVNQYQRLRVEAHLEQEVNAEGPREQARLLLAKERFLEGMVLINKRYSTGLTAQEEIRYARMWVFDRPKRP
jgi:hypothetical protein